MCNKVVFLKAALGLSHCRLPARFGLAYIYIALIGTLIIEPYYRSLIDPLKGTPKPYNKVKGFVSFRGQRFLMGQAQGAGFRLFGASGLEGFGLRV